MTNKSETKKDYLEEALHLSKKFSRTQKSTGATLIATYFLIYTLSIIRIRPLLDMLHKDKELFISILNLALAYVPTILASIFFKIILSRISTVKFKYVKNLMISFFNMTIIALLSPIEFLIFPLKTLIFCVFIYSGELRTAYITEGYQSYIYACWVLIDFIFTLGITEIKVSFLRGYSPKSGFFSKLNGIFEELITLVMPIVLLLNTFGSDPKVSSTSYWIYYVAKIGLLILVELIYLKELPFFSKFAEQIYGHIYSLFVVFLAIYGATGRDIDTALKIWCFVIPFQIICLFYYLKKVYRINFLRNNKQTNLLVMKKILMSGSKFKTAEEKIFDFGVFKNHLINGKSVNKEYINIWKMKAKLKGISKKSSYHPLGTHGNDEEPDAKKIDFNEEECSKKIFNQIHNQVLNDFIKDSRGSNYSHLIKILWMLENHIVVNEILKSMGQMIGKAKSLKDKFMYRYAKRQIQEKLKGYYFHKDIYFNKTSRNLKEKKIIKIEQELKKINDVGVDLAYAFKYRARIEKMIKLIQEFVELNKKFVTLLGAQSKALSELNSLSSKLYVLKGKIDYAFDQLHSETRNVEATHLTPYFYFLVKTVNLHRSASKIFKIYKQRMINKRNLIDEKSMILKDVNLFSQSLIMMVESRKKGFGTILEVYGDTKYLKVRPLELKGKHMDCLIMESQRAAHNISCDIFNENVMSPIIGDTVKSFIKLPARDLMLPVTYNIKIIPYEETDFKYVVGVKYNRSDSKMHVLLDKNNKVDCFSYNMKYVFKRAEEFLDKKKPLKELSKECYDRIVKIDREMKRKRKMESGSFESTNQATNPLHARKTKNLINEFDSKPSFSNFGSNLDREIFNSENGFLAKFNFKNKFTSEIVKRYFRVNIENKHYVYGNFKFKILTLEIDEQATKNNLLEYKDKNSMQKVKTNEKELEEDEFEEEEVDELPPIESDRNHITNTIRNSESGFKFMKGKTDSSKASTAKKNILSEIEKPEEKINTKGKKEKKKNILDDDTIFEKSHVDNKINFLESDKAIKPKEEKSEKSRKSSVRSDMSQGYDKMKGEGDSFLMNEKFEIVNSMEEDEFDEDKNFSDLNKKHKMIEGTGSVFSNSNIQTHKKYFAFEDAVKKNAGLMETLSIIVLYVLSIGATIFFTIYIQSELKLKNNEFETGNDVFTSFAEHTLESQMFYSKLLSAVAYNKGIYSKDRYGKFNFSTSPLLEELSSTEYTKLPYDLADLETYLKYQLETSRDSMITLLNKIYKFMGDFGDNNKKFFDLKVSYNQHEVNGTAIKKSMGIYQGYLLLTTTKAIEITNLEISKITPESLNRNVLYFLDNSMNGIPTAFESFNDFLYDLMTKNYNEFMSFVYLCLFIIIGLTVILMIASVCSIFKVKKMFWEIYQCYLGISKSEFDERSRQLNLMTKMMEEFKESNYFKDFMSFNDFTLPKKSSSKKGKKYTDSLYCFKLLYSVGFIGLFYTIQICFSSGMMLIFKDSVEKGIWICVKQNDMKQVLMDEFFYYNSLKQKLILGDEKKVFGKPVMEYIPDLKLKMKRNSDTIMKLFEDRDDNAYTPLKDYLSSHSNSSLCSYTKNLIDRAELCHLLDNKLPLRGIVQVYFRVSQYFDEIYSQVKNEGYSSNDLLNDSEFVEVEYTFENVYYWTFVFLEHQVHEYFEDFVFLVIDKDVALIINLMVAFIAISFFFIVFSFKNIINQISRVSFTFQLLSINTVINNTGIKYRFLKVYRLNQKHF